MRKFWIFLCNLGKCLLPFSSWRFWCRTRRLFFRGENNHVILVQDGKESECPFWSIPAGLAISFQGNDNLVKIHLVHGVSPAKELKKRFPKGRISFNGDGNKVEFAESRKGFHRPFRLTLINQASAYFGRNFLAFGEMNISLDGTGGASLTIGDDTIWGWIDIRNEDGHVILDRQTGKVLNAPRSIRIGNHVWINGPSLFLKGAVIPDDCIIGTHSLITKAFTESGCVITGIPAHVTRTGVTWDGKSAAQMLESQKNVQTSPADLQS